jgi:hypothetical protein
MPHVQASVNYLVSADAPAATPDDPALEEKAAA